MRWSLTPPPLWIGLGFHVLVAVVAYYFVLFVWSVDPGWGGVAALVVIPLALYDWMQFAKIWVQAFRSLPPAEQYLRHASQGAATMVVVVLLARWLVPDWAVLQRQYTTDPYTFWPACLAICAPFGISLVRFFSGMAIGRFFVFQLTAAALAAARLAVGIAIWRTMWPTPFHLIMPWRSEDGWMAIVTITGAWLAVTGLIRLLIVSGVLQLVPSIWLRGTGALRRLIRREKVYGDGGFAEITATRIRLRK